MDISWITEFINQLPELMLYLVQGTIFVSLYDFILFKNRERKTSFYFIKIIVISYILKIGFDFIFPQIDQTSALYIIGLCLFSALLSYLIALCFKTEWFKAVMRKIKISRTLFDNIWDDVIEDNTWVRVFEKDTNRVYMGLYKYGENFQREPIIVLYRWQVQDADSGEVLFDYSNDYSRRIMLNMKDFQKVEIIYSRKS